MPVSCCPEAAQLRPQFRRRSPQTALGLHTCSWAGSLCGLARQMVWECACARGFSPPKRTPRRVEAEPLPGKQCSFPRRRWCPAGLRAGRPHSPRSLAGARAAAGTPGCAAGGLAGPRVHGREAGALATGGAEEAQARGRGEASCQPHPQPSAPRVTCQPSRSEGCWGVHPPHSSPAFPQGGVI